MFERFISPAALLLWLALGAAYGSLWYAVTASWPPIWARLVGGALLFVVVTPLEAALARRHRRRTQPVTRHRKTTIPAPTSPTEGEA